MEEKLENQSHYDPSRKTVGAIYRDMKIAGARDPEVIESGDMLKEVLNGLVEDINDGLAANPFDGKPFYLMVHEKRDGQMKDAFLRRILFFSHDKRPWPEDDTLVYWHDPQSDKRFKFCWNIPHWSEMDNILACKDLFDADLVATVVAWKSFNMYYFGFTKDPMGEWMPNPYFEDQDICKPKTKLIRPLLLSI